MLNKFLVVIVAAIVAAAGIFSVVYFYRTSHDHQPIYSNNSVKNETVAEDFLNYTSSGSPPTPVYAFHSATYFSYRGLDSSLTMNMVNFEPFYEPLGGPFPFVFVQLAIIVVGNITKSLSPTGVMVSVSDVSPYNNSDVYVFAFTYHQPYPPYSNVTVPSSAAFGAQQIGNFSFHASFGLIKQKSINESFQFGLFAVFNVEFLVYPHQNGIGTHIIHVVASLQGLGVPVFTEINTLLIDTK